MPLHLNFRIDIDGHPTIDRTLQVYNDKLRDFTPAFRVMIDYLQQYESQVFTAEGSSDELKPWAALTEPYATRKQKQYPGSTILIRSRVLYNSLIGTGVGNISLVSNRNMEYGTEIPYAIYHQRGTRHMTARPILRLGNRARNKLTQILAKSIDFEGK